MWGVFKKIVGLKVSSITVMALIGVVAIALATRAKGNNAATWGSLLCVGVFAFMGFYLIVYNHVSELFQSVIENEREGHRQVLKNYRELTREQTRTAVAREKSARETMQGGVGALSPTFSQYREVSVPTGTDE